MEDYQKFPFIPYDFFSDFGFKLSLESWTQPQVVTYMTSVCAWNGYNPDDTRYYQMDFCNLHGFERGFQHI